MRYIRFKPQTVRNAKCSYHCSGPLESYLYTQMCTVNFLILMFLSQIYRTQSKKNELAVTSQIHKICLLFPLMEEHGRRRPPSPPSHDFFEKPSIKTHGLPWDAPPLTNEAPQLKNSPPPIDCKILK